MKTKLSIILLFVLNLTLQAQLTPWQAASLMGRGINIGNSFDAPNGETSWGNPLIVEENFDDYKAAGFTSIRIPITWDKRTATSSPYTINPDFLDRIEQVVDWALSRGFIVIINAHHEEWLKTNFNETNLARFDSIWAQVSRRFKDKSDHLLFEIINEPYPLALEKVNQLNAQILTTIRKTNPTRIIIFSGHMWSNIDELLAASIPNDTMLIGYYHSYDPYPFGLEGTGTFGSAADIKNIEDRFKKAINWSNEHNIPVILSEFGSTRKGEYNARMYHYATVVSLALQYQIPFFVWDDGGDFQIYLRSLRKWNEIKDIIIHTYPQSPTQLNIDNYADTLIILQWANRNPFNDSIIIERKVQTGDFVFYQKVGPNTTSFIDNNVNTKGNYYYYRLKTKINDSTYTYSYPVRLKNIKPVRSAYNNTPANVPGTLEAEKFDVGLNDDAYHDMDIENLGGAYRLGPGVDIYKNGSTYFVAHTAPGEWTEYTLNIQKFGKYKVNCFASSPEDESHFKIIFDNTDSLYFTVPKTDTITQFTIVSQEVVLNTGTHIMRVLFTDPKEIGLDKINFQFLTYVEKYNQEIITFSPNPFKDYIKITTPSTPAYISFYRLDGTLVKNYLLNSFNQVINTQSLYSGIYIVKIKTSSGIKTSKLIKY